MNEFRPIYQPTGDRWCNVDCLRCNLAMEYLKEYKFESQDNNRGVFGALFDVEERLIFDLYVCPQCRRSESIYKGAKRHYDGD